MFKVKKNSVLIIFKKMFKKRDCHMFVEHLKRCLWNGLKYDKNNRVILASF